MTPLREVSAKFIVPMNQLVGKSSNQKEGPGRRVPKCFVLDVYTIGCCLCHADSSLSTTYVKQKRRLELPKTSIALGHVFGNGILAFLETELKKQP
jgi:hypothetical protein